MSNNTNSILFDRAREAVEYSAGKWHGQAIEDAIKINDLDEVERLVREVERVMFENEYDPEGLQEKSDEVRQGLKEDGVAIPYDPVGHHFSEAKRHLRNTPDERGDAMRGDY